MQCQNTPPEYKCPNCGENVHEWQKECENCKTSLEWGVQTQEVKFLNAQKMSAFEGYKAFLGTISQMFKGRARRKEYWGTMLFHFLLLLPSIVFSGLLMISQSFIILYMLYIYLITIYMMVATLPLWALSVKRLHDIGKSGWWLLIGLIPFVGWIFTLVWSFTDSQKGINQYGESPKYNNRG